MVARAPFRDEAEARQILHEKVEELRGYGYDRLRAMNTTRVSLSGVQVARGDPPVLEDVVAPSGRAYQVEADVACDQKSGGAL